MNVISQVITETHSLYHGDSTEIIRGIPENSIHYSIYSPPFDSLYTYSNSERDMGNSRSPEEFLKHLGFLGEGLFRAIMPGRLMSFHCMNLPISKQHNGYIGIRDFRGELIRLFQQCGFIFHSEVCIWKNPVTAMQRTKALGLLHKQICKDSAMSRQGIADYMVTMRKPGENPEPINDEFEIGEWVGEESQAEFERRIYQQYLTTDKKMKFETYISVNIWQRYASPVWMDIDQGRTLSREEAREEKDERHVCTLQLDAIERALTLWTNPNDIVLSPFAGIGSEIYSAVKMGRRGIGVELKKSYFDQAVKNCERAAQERNQNDLFSFMNEKGEPIESNT